MSGGGDPTVGGVGEEAAKLLQALQDWAKESGSEYADATATAAAGAASTFRQVNEHIATGGEDCRYCPVCKAIHVVRSTSPEVREHLSIAASSLMHAAAGLLATNTADRSGSSPVEKIDLDGGTDWDEEP